MNHLTFRVNTWTPDGESIVEKCVTDIQTKRRIVGAAPVNRPVVISLSFP
jgi:hypothetical protein